MNSSTKIIGLAVFLGKVDRIKALLNVKLKAPLSSPPEVKRNEFLTIQCSDEIGMKFEHDQTKRVNAKSAMFEILFDITEIIESFSR